MPVNLDNFKPVELSPEEQLRAKAAKKSADALSYKPSQEEIYYAVTFKADHIVGHERNIPISEDDLILSPGHLDTLFQLGVITEEELFKVSQNTLQEGVQKGSESMVKVNGDALTLKKKADEVFAVLDLGFILHRDSFDHPDIQTIFMQMIEQQAGSLSVNVLDEITKREVAHLKKLPNAEYNTSVLKTEVEVKLRRIIMQELALYHFLQNAQNQRPEILEIHKSDGKSLFSRSILQFLKKDLGEELDNLDLEKVVQQRIAKIFG